MSSGTPTPPISGRALRGKHFRSGVLFFLCVFRFPFAPRPSNAFVSSPAPGPHPPRPGAAQSRRTPGAATSASRAARGFGSRRRGGTSAGSGALRCPPHRKTTRPCACASRSAGATRARPSRPPSRPWGGRTRSTQRRTPRKRRPSTSLDAVTAAARVPVFAPHRVEDLARVLDGRQEGHARARHLALRGLVGCHRHEPAPPLRGHAFVEPRREPPGVNKSRIAVRLVRTERLRDAAGEVSLASSGIVLARFTSAAASDIARGRAPRAAVVSARFSRTGRIQALGRVGTVS